MRPNDSLRRGGEKCYGFAAALYRAALRFFACERRTALDRLRELRHPAALRATELIVGAVTLLWGCIVMVVPNLFGNSSLYRGFRSGTEGWWSAWFIVLGLVVFYAALTRSRWVRVQIMGVTAISFAQMVYWLTASEIRVPAPIIYTFIGIVLPLAVALYLLILSVAEDEVRTLNTSPNAPSSTD